MALPSDQNCAKYLGVEGVAYDLIRQTPFHIKLGGALDQQPVANPIMAKEKPMLVATFAEPNNLFVRHDSTQRLDAIGGDLPLFEIVPCRFKASAFQHRTRK